MNKDRWHPIEERFTEDNAKPPASTMETDDVALSDKKSDTACNTESRGHCPCVFCARAVSDMTADVM